MSAPLIVRTVALPISIDLGATFLFSITGAMVAIRRHYDPIGLFVLALACGLGGGLLRDGLFIQTGPPAAMRNGGYMIAVLAGCVVAIVFFRHVERLSKPFLVFDALGTAAYGVVGASRAFEAGLAIPACIFVGVVNAVARSAMSSCAKSRSYSSPGSSMLLPHYLARPNSPCSPSFSMLLWYRLPFQRLRSRSCSVWWRSSSTGRP